MNNGRGDDALLSAIRRQGLDTVDGAFAFIGGADLHKPNLANRRRTRLTLTDETGTAHELYLKRYGRLGLVARLLRRLTCRQPVSQARAEFQNIRAVRQAGVPTMRELAFDEAVGPLGELRSHILVAAVPGEAFSRCGQQFVDRCDGRALETFTAKLVGLVSSLHRAGLVHRDLYAAHLFLHEHDGTFDLYLIDLARVFQPRRRKFRWFVKDLAGIKYSMPPAWVERCWDEFLANWRDAVMGGNGRSVAAFQHAIDRRVRAMRKRSARKARHAVR